jgi:hypothetical protein
MSKEKMTITTEMKAYYNPDHFGPVCGMSVTIWNERVGPHLAEIDAAAANARKMARAEEWARQTANSLDGQSDLSTIQAVGDRAYSEKFQQMVNEFSRGHALGFYFPLSKRDANALRARINSLAQCLGYSTAATLLQAIDRGDVALIMLAPEEIPNAISVLDALPDHDDWPHAIVRALRAAIERGREADARDPDGYRAYLEAKKASLQTGNISPDWEG